MNNDDDMILLRILLIVAWLITISALTFQAIKYLFKILN